MSYLAGGVGVEVAMPAQPLGSGGGRLASRGAWQNAPAQPLTYVRLR